MENHIQTENAQKHCQYCNKNVLNYDLHVIQCQKIQQRNQGVNMQEKQRQMDQQSMNKNTELQNEQKISQKKQKYPQLNYNKQDQKPDTQMDIEDDIEERKINEVINNINPQSNQNKHFIRENGNNSYHHPLNLQKKPSEIKEEVKCPNCSEKLNLDQITTHIQQCQNRDVACQFCDQVYPLSLLDEHLEVCESAEREYRQQQQLRRSRSNSLSQNSPHDQNLQRLNEQQQRQQQQRQQQQREQELRQLYERQQQERQQQRQQQLRQQQQRQQQQRQQQQRQSNDVRNIFEQIFGISNEERQNENQRMEEEQRYQNNRRNQQQQVQVQFDPFQILFGQRPEQNNLRQQRQRQEANNPGLFALLNMLGGNQGQSRELEYLFQNGNLEGYDHSNNGGLTKEQMKNFPVHKFQKRPEMSEDQCTCSICMCDYEENEDVKILDCMHRYHPQCIDQWLSKNTACPICKKDLKEFVQ